MEFDLAAFTLPSTEQLSALAVLIGIPIAIFQLHHARVLDRGRNTIDLLKYLASPELMKARYALHEIDLAKPYAAFTKEERIICSDVCAAYALAGVLSRKRLVDGRTVIDNWGPSIEKNYERLKNFMAGRRAAYRAGADFWRDFEWLAAQSRKQLG